MNGINVTSQSFYACFVMRFHQICLIEAIAEDSWLDKLTKWGNTAFVLLSVISLSNDKLFYEMVVHCFLILHGKYRFWEASCSRTNCPPRRKSVIAAGLQWTRFPSRSSPTPLESPGHWASEGLVEIIKILSIWVRVSYHPILWLTVIEFPFFHIHDGNM